MSDIFTETTSTSWFSRIGNSIKGIVIGLILIVASFPVIFVNEGCAVKIRKTLDQGSKEFVPIEASPVNPDNEGKLVHLSGAATSTGSLSDEKFGISAEALVLKRVVEMYQWKESSEEKTKKKLGGGTDTTTTYNYEKVWQKGRIDSSNFHKASEYTNPSPKISSDRWRAKNITVGGFTLNDGMVEKINAFKPVRVHADKNTEAIAASSKKIHLHDGIYYYGKSPDAPELGDLKISFQHVPNPTEVSIIAKQHKQGFETFTGKSGSTIYMLSVGQHSAAAMFAKAQQNNKIRTWIVRLVGFLLMFFGFSLLFKPFSVLADVLPIAGTIVGIGTSIVAFLLALPLSLATMALAWIAYRPIIGIPLLLGAVVGFFFLIKKFIAYRRSH